jgi:Na+-translocating ferredoxin:NAD+ oxidoreductase RnfG subunit
MRFKTLTRQAIAVFVFLFFVAPCFAMTLLTQKEALRLVFGEDARIVSEQKALPVDRIEAVKKKVGKCFRAQKEYTFYFGEKEGKRLGAAIILEAPGKWGPIQFIVVLDLDAKVRDVLVMRYTETRGRPIARKTFLRQFIGKTGKDAFVLNKDVVAISGATISSQAAACTVKEAIALYEELCL